MRPPGNTDLARGRVALTLLIRLALAAGLAAGGLGRPLAAQESPPADTLLARLTAEALAANPSLEADRAAARAAAARVRAAGALPDPMLSFGVMRAAVRRRAPSPDSLASGVASPQARPYFMGSKRRCCAQRK